MAAKLSEIARISQQAEAEVREQGLARTSEPTTGDEGDASIDQALQNNSSLTNGVSADSIIVSEHSEFVDVAADNLLGADPSNLLLTHDLGEANRLSNDANVTKTVDSETEVDTEAEAEAEAEAKPNDVVEDGNSVDVDLGTDANEQESSDGYSAESEQATDSSERTEPKASLIDIHLVDLGDANDVFKAAEEKAEVKRRVAAEREIEKRKVEERKAAKQTTPMSAAQRLSSRVKNTLPKRSPEANAQAFEQLLATSKSDNKKPKFVENFTPQDMTRPLVHREPQSVQEADQAVEAKGSVSSSVAETEKLQQSVAAASTSPVSTGFIETTVEKAGPSEENNGKHVLANEAILVEPSAEPSGFGDQADNASSKSLKLANELTENVSSQVVLESVEAAQKAESAEVAGSAEVAQSEDATAQAESSQQSGLESLLRTESEVQAEIVAKSGNSQSGAESDASLQGISNDAAQSNDTQALLDEADATESDREEAQVIAEIDQLSQSSQIESELAEAFANLDLSLDSSALDVSLSDDDAPVVEGPAKEQVEEQEPLLFDTEVIGFNKKDKPQVTGTAKPSVLEASPELKPVDDSATKSILPNVGLGLSIAGILKRENKVEVKTDDVSTMVVSENQSNGQSNGKSDDMREGNAIEPMLTSASDIVTRDDADQHTMASLYDTPDYSLDDTTSFGFGGVPKGSVTNPQTHFVRVWSAVKRATRKLVDRAASWLKRRGKS